MTKSKGFYFSFDSFLALTVMIGVLTLVAQSSDITSDPLGAESVVYTDASTTGQDSLQIASQESFVEAFSSSEQEELLENTEMEEDDLERNIVDGITFMWANREFDYAEKTVENYFDSKIDDDYEYQLRITEENETTVYETSELPENPSIAASTSRLISGHRIDEPSEGFTARARATEATTNQTEVYTFPPMGGAREGGDLWIRRQFDLEEVESVKDATLHVSVHYGCNEADFQQLFINGQNIQSEFEEDHRQRDCDGFDDRGTAAYGTIEGDAIVDNLEEGENTVEMRFSNQEYGAYLHPGMRMEVEFEDVATEEASDLKTQSIPFNDMVAEEQGGSKTGGFAVNMFEIPEGSEVEEVSFSLRAEDIDQVYESHVADTDGFFGSGDGWNDDHFDETCRGETVSDIMVYFNDEELYTSGAPDDGEVYLDFDMDEDDLDVVEGTNVVTAYFNSYADCTWGTEETHIVGSYTDEENYSSVDTSYSQDASGLVFGEIDVTTTEEVGGSTENPKHYTEEFERDVQSSFLHIGKLFSASIEVGVDPFDGTEKEAFRSELARSVPSSLYIDPEFYSTPGENTIRMEDYEHSNGESTVQFVPESSLETTVRVPSQVGLGDLFETEEEAVEDSEKRLQEVMGDYAEATDIETDEITTGDQPYIWGPASVDLVIWSE